MQSGDGAPTKGMVEVHDELEAQLGARSTLTGPAPAARAGFPSGATRER
ncbi:MAG TPA: hypothetical protein VND92_06690 [Vicinamibacterales bacterium]|nr:hypothetical protein [Vicinamibacterales bacterium]